MDSIDEIRQAYRRVIEVPMGETVLNDIGQFCCDDWSDKGKLEVFEHILDMYGLTLSEVIRAIQKIPAHKKEEQEKADNDQ
jgi:hypothetical protein